MFGGQEYKYFAHSYNCGWPTGLCTERTVELALADRWLTGVALERVCEIGAVTPYYWPHRVHRVVDPTDPHTLVSDRRSVLDVSLAGANVLSISTIEHIGREEYGLSADGSLLKKSLAKLFSEGQVFLVTFPTGYNLTLDALVLEEGLVPPDVAVRCLTRESAEAQWYEESDLRKARKPYGPHWAKTVVVLERGGTLARIAEIPV
jgi:hypothetical protein